MKRLILIVLLLFGLSFNAYAAGICTVTSDGDYGILKVTWTWISDASGDVSGVGSHTVSGIPYAVEFNVATTYPSDAHDVTLIDSDSLDLLDGFGANLQNGTDTSLTYARTYRSLFTTDGGYMSLVGKALTPVVANAGDTKSGTIILYLIQSR